MIRFDDEAYLAIRPAWVLDRFCGSQLYWQTFFDFGTEKDLRGQQFSQAMNYVFEESVGYLFRRVSRRAGSAITLITEKEMQQAWAGKNTPSVCDWVLVSGKYCLLVDATNHWLDEKAAQGFAKVEDYTADVEETFINKKFQQLKSTIELLAENGWDGCHFDDQTVYVPMVIVPNSGIPPAATRSRSASPCGPSPATSFKLIIRWLGRSDINNHPICITAAARARTDAHRSYQNIRGRSWSPLRPRPRLHLAHVIWRTHHHTTGV